MYDNYQENIRLADALRYFVLHEYGGVYADMDMESIKPMDPLMIKYSCLIGQEPYVHPAMDSNVMMLAINAILACRPRHPFTRAMIDALPHFQHMWHVLDSTGPHFVTNVLKTYSELNKNLKPEHKNGTYLAPAEYFYPNIDSLKLGYIYKHCAERYDSLSELRKRACHSLKWRLPQQERLKLAFTCHHWSHTWLQPTTEVNTIPINTFVPNVKIYPDVLAQPAN